MQALPQFPHVLKNNLNLLLTSPTMFIIFFFYNFADLENVSAKQEPEQEAMETNTFDGKNFPAPRSCGKCEQKLFLWDGPVFPHKQINGFWGK